MKLSAFILSLVVISMTILPNFDGHACTDHHGEHHHHGEHDHGQDSPDAPDEEGEDHCTAFCHCHGGVILHDISNEIPSTANVESDTSLEDQYQSHYGLDFLNRIWHPPV